MGLYVNPESKQRILEAFLYPETFIHINFKVKPHLDSNGY